ncbi:unnamed protein product [Hapterophycus canaliculatus]
MSTQALRQAGVELIVAPYEADAQLAFLSRTGAVDVVISEDSDCLLYGCKKVLFKMDNEGQGQEIQLRNLAANTPLSLSNWKNSMFLDLCLLVGCDYISTSVKGLGIATAHKLVDRYRSLDKIMSAVDSSKFVVPEDYWAQYKRARLTFRHHIVYNPQTEHERSMDASGSHLRDGDRGWDSRFQIEGDCDRDGPCNVPHGVAFPAPDSEARRQPGWRENYAGTAGADVGVRQGDTCNSLVLTGEPPDADQAKWVPAAAHHFHSTQVGHGLETLQRRKRRLEQGGDPEWPELPGSGQPPGIQPDDALEAHRDKVPVFEGGAGASSEEVWMVQATPESPRSTYRPARREYEAVSARLMATGREEGSEARVLTATSRRWTLPSSVPLPGNMEGLPLLRLLDGRREHSLHGRMGDPRSLQPLPMAKRVRGTTFWDAQLLR